MKFLQLDSNHAILREELEKNGISLDDDFTSDYNQILNKISQYDGIILRSRIPMDANFLRRSGIKCIARVGAGMENIDQETAKELGIALINSPEGNRDAVAEHALGMLLLLTNRLRIASEEVKKGLWLREENRGDELMGKTVALIGYGNMGKATAKRFAGFGCRVICYDILPNLGDMFAEQVSIEEIWKEANILSLHLPQSPSTEYWLDELMIMKMNKPFYLINTARGKNVKTSALVSALQSGKIKGACLDVLEYEKASFEKLNTIPDDLKYLLHSEKVIITPHIAGWTHQSKVKMAKIIAQKIISYKSNLPF